MDEKTFHGARYGAQHNKGADSLVDEVDQQADDSAGMKIGGNELDSKRLIRHA